MNPIKGIGPARQQLLRERLSIHTVQDLAAASAEMIEALFRSAGQSVTRSKAADWITQARHLADSAVSDGPSDSDPVAAQISSGADVISPDQVPSEGNGSKDNPEPQPDRPHATDASAELITLRMGQIRVIQPPETGVPQVATACDRSLPGPLLNKQPFQISLTFELDGLASLPLSPQASYSLQGFVKSLAYPPQTTALGESPAHFLAGHRSPYSALITVPGLASGLYRLQLLIAFQGISIPFGMHEIPRFQVV
ncbi:hypothetical protein NIES30_23965 [Phormidium tenue NIES-30]|uniref:DUF4332 domain-containing protein n=1 Tax=Phormidium tenue NIES-30 TaxID=549789 RepID=A0A1U7IYP8_9CYAN|nr:hypothetical protein NIES30_23965 [Phormidium tenue NIES-30]